MNICERFFIEMADDLSNRYGTEGNTCTFQPKCKREYGAGVAGKLGSPSRFTRTLNCGLFCCKNRQAMASQLPNNVSLTSQYGTLEQNCISYSCKY